LNEPFEVGIKTIDGLLTCGKGQKVGIFAGSDVGKTTLMGMIVRGSNAPVKVVALIDKQDSEVPEFIQKNLGEDSTNTVLAEDDDMSDPIADQSRSILDGHIVLSRDLSDLGIYPPINIQNSASHVMGDVITPNHQRYVTQFRRYNSMVKENEILLRIGAYQKGSNMGLDTPIEKRSPMERFMQQTPSEVVPFKKSIETLEADFYYA